MSKFRREKKTPNRFHGAFQGGFSAGHFNTVGSSEGWAPSNYDNEKKQSIQDFMDDEDEETWGGVVSVQNDYQDRSSALSNAIQKTTQTKNQTHNQDDRSSLMLLPVEYLESTFDIQDRVGMKLLKQLGWDFNNANQRPIKLPPPKHDYYGMDYDPYKNAPEFQTARDQIRARANKRAANAIGGGMDSYHTSQLKLTEEQEDGSKRPFHRMTQDPSYTYTTINETLAEDFIGDKTVSGFALKDDADDVYDFHSSNPTSANPSSQYHTHIYESSDSDNDHHFNTVATKSKKSDMGGTLDQALNDWAHTSHPTQSTGNPFNTATGLTADGRPPLSGFKLGADTIEQMIRWPGPDVPRDYRVDKHIFKEEKNEETRDLLQKYPIDYGFPKRPMPKRPLSSNDFVQSLVPTSHPKRVTMDSKFGKPMAGPAFPQLAISMKNRFTSSSSSTTTTKNDTIQLRSNNSGLTTPNATTISTSTPNNNLSFTTQKEPHEIKRVVTSWIPSSLLCKRLQVPVPKISSKTLHSHSNSNAISQKQGGNLEQSYFDSTIQPLVSSSKGGTTQTTQKESTSSNTGSKAGFPNEQQDDILPVPKRPPLDLFQAIFQSDSDSEESTIEQQSHATPQNNISTKAPISNTTTTTTTTNMDSVENDTTKGESAKPIHTFVRKRDRRRELHHTKKEPSNEYNKPANDETINTDTEQSYRNEPKSGSKRRTKHSRRRKDRKSHRRSHPASDASHSDSSSSSSSDKERRRKRHRKHRRKKHSRSSEDKRRHHRSSSSRK